MKYKTLLPALVIGVSSWFVSPAFADHEKGHTDAAMQNLGDFRISNLINAKVKDTSGDRIGHIEDFVVDPNSGRIQFAVLKLGGGLFKGGEYTPIPWPLLAKSCVDLNRSGEPKDVVLNVEREKLSSAQKFSVAHWPEKSHAVWGQDVYTYYGVQWDQTTGAGATGSGVTTDTGTIRNYDNQDQNLRRDKNAPIGNPDKPLDNGTAPDGKDTLKLNPRPTPNPEKQPE